jgi:DNA-directed RNA polymerase subunit RPC12/RpoP
MTDTKQSKKNIAVGDKMKKQEWKDYVCPYCNKDVTYPCGIKKGDYLCNGCGKHFNIYSKYLMPSLLSTEALTKHVMKLFGFRKVIKNDEKRKYDKTKAKR